MFRRKSSKSHPLLQAIRVLAISFALATTAFPQDNLPDITDGFTPPGIEPGTPIGSYLLDGFDSISYYTGKLNLALPLWTVGGRGQAGYTITLPISTDWTVDQYGDCDEFGVCTSDWTDPEPDYGHLVRHRYGPGLLRARALAETERCADGNTGKVWTLTRLNFETPDGSQIELRDKLTNGERLETDYQCLETPTAQPPSRGKEFVSTDGSAITFISDTDFIDHEGNPGVDTLGHPTSGYLYFPDGRRYRIDDELVSEIRDRNGNLVTITYDANSRVDVITDPLDREIKIIYPPFGIVGTDEIQIKDLSGAVRRTIKVYHDSLTNLLFSGTLKEIRDSTPGQPNALFPSLGPQDSNIDVPFDPDFLVSKVELPLDPNDPGATARHYEFKYNAYAEIAEVKLPTGGSRVYEWEPYAQVVSGKPDGISNNQAFRRVRERRVYDSGVLQSKMKITTSLSTTCTLGSSNEGLQVDVVNEDSGGSAMTRERHQYCGRPDEINATVTFPAPFRHGSWKSGREVSSEQRNTANTQALRITTQVYNQRDYVIGDEPDPWWKSEPLFGSLEADNAPGNDVRLTQSETTLETAQTTKTTFAYDRYNNRTDVHTFDYNQATTAARRTHTSYKTDFNYPDEPIHLRRLVKQHLVCGSGTDECNVADAEAQSDFTWDTNANLMSPGAITGHDTTFTATYTTRGNLTDITRDTGSGTVSVKAEYDVAGNRTKITDAESNQTTFDYEDPGAATEKTYAYATTVIRAATSPVEQTLQAEYDYDAGLMTTLTDVNGVDTTFSYDDPLDRMTEAVQAVGKPEAFRTKFEYGDTIGNLFVKTRVTRTNFAVLNTVSLTAFDSLGRASESRQYESESTWIQTDTQFDDLGRTKQSSNPYRPGDTIEWTVNSYDSLSRVTDVTHSDNSNVHTEYVGNVTKVTDEAGKNRDTTTDALGRLTQVIEDPGGLGYLTSYTYDALDNLIAVSQSGQNRSFAYDALSRLVCASNPESRSDPTTCSVTAPTSGVDRFTYDNNGNVLTKADSRGVTATWGEYDALNRPTTTTYSDGTPTVSFNYHTAGAGPCFNKGQLQSVVNSISTNSYPCYDALGRATQSSQITDGTTYGFNYSYNLDSTVETQTYPAGGLTVAFKYDSAGRPIKAGRNTVGAIDFAQNITYEPHGAPDQFTLGNGLVETTTYNDRLQPCTITASTLLTLTFKYGATDSGNCDVTSNDNNGNILTQVINGDGLPTFTQTYTYDAVNRIKTVGENSNFWQRIYSYDAFGNRAATGAGIVFGSPTPTVVTQFDAATNRIEFLPNGDPLDPDTDPMMTADDPYDAAGNLVRHPIVGSMAYDANNKQRFYCAGHVTCGSGNAIAEYRYDGAGNRVEKLTSAETTTFVYDAFGKLAAEYSTTAPTNGGLFFRTLDHLGSTRLVTDAASPPNVVSRRDFLPFGEHIPANATFNRDGLSAAGYNAGSAFNQQFTAKERDDESGLDYFLARYYSAKLGRFTSADAPFADQRQIEPQSWNLYSYVSNQSLTHLDPTGRGKIGKFFKVVTKRVMDNGRSTVFKKITKKAMSRDEARRAFRKRNQDIFGSRKGTKNAAGKNPIEDPVHGRGAGDKNPHFHDADRSGGHAFFKDPRLGTLVPGGAAGKEVLGEDSGPGQFLDDWLNPLSDIQDLVDIFDDVVDILNSEVDEESSGGAEPDAGSSGDLVPNRPPSADDRIVEDEIDPNVLR